MHIAAANCLPLFCHHCLDRFADPALRLLLRGVLANDLKASSALKRSSVGRKSFSKSYV